MKSNAIRQPGDGPADREVPLGETGKAKNPISRIRTGGETRGRRAVNKVPTLLGKVELHSRANGDPVRMR